MHSEAWNDRSWRQGKAEQCGLGKLLDIILCWNQSTFDICLVLLFQRLNKRILGPFSKQRHFFMTHQ